MAHDRGKGGFSRPADPLYRELEAEVRSAGFFEPDPWGYIRKGAVCLALYVAAYVGVLAVDHPLALGALLVLLALMSVQLAYLAHDAGHGAMTRNPRLAWAVGHFGMTFITGFSFSWWMHSHGNHHEFVNEEESDLAMRYSTVLSVHENTVLAKTGFKRTLVRWQAWYIWLLIPFYHFPMIIDGLVHCLRNPRATRVDQIVLPLYLVLWFVIPSQVVGWERAMLHYLADTMIGSTLIGFTFIVHHMGRKVVRPDENISRFQQQVEATRNVRTWRIFDAYYSGLNYHAPHHLFPNIPHWRYRRLHELLQRFCADKGIRYTEESFFAAVANVFRYLRWLGQLPHDHEVTPESERQGWTAAGVPAPHLHMTRGEGLRG